jgi:hypothetical protein
MKKLILVTGLLATMISAGHVIASDVTYRKDIRPIWENNCMACHGSESPYLGEFEENEKRFEQESKGPRMDTYADLITFIGWPDTGAVMRRLDDGKKSGDGKPGNMYENLGDTDEEQANNLNVFKAWVGEGGWVLKRFHKKGDVPAITKDELDKIKVTY